MKERTRGFLYGLNMWVENEKGWFVAESMQALFEWDKNTQRCKLVNVLPDYEEVRLYGNSRCVKYKDYVYCLPHFGTCIWLYDLSSKAFDKIEIDNAVDVNIDMNYVGQKDGYIFGFSHNLKKMFKIDGEKKKLETFLLLEGEIEEHSNFIIRENRIITWCKNDAAICSIDIAGGNVNMEYVRDLKGKTLGICYDGKAYWFAGKEPCIYVWNSIGKNLECISDFSLDFMVCCDKKEPTFGAPIYMNGSILVPQWRANRSICIDTETREWEEMILGDWFLDTTNEGLPLSYQYMIDERYVGFYSWTEHRVIEVDVQQKNWCYKDFIDGQAIAEFLRKNPKWYKYYLGETELHRMFFGEMMEEDSKKELVRMEKQIGMLIHDKM